MKKKFLVLISCLICCILFVVGCGPAPLTGGPDINDNVYGNGGTVVRKGSYLYFSNAFYSYQSVGVNQNKYGDETPSAIYRVKIGDNGLVEFDEDGAPIGAEVLAKQVTGYENGGMYIFGEYIYYTTPYTSRDKDGNDIKGLVQFCRVKLNGTEYKSLYTTSVLVSKENYSIVEIDNKVYITVAEDSKIVSIKVDGARVDVKTLVEESSGNVLVRQTDVSVNDGLSEFNQYVYYTRAADKDKDGVEGTVVAKIKIDGSAKEEKLATTQEEIVLSKVANNRIFVEKAGCIYSSKELKFTDADLVKYTNQKTTTSQGLLGEYFVVEDINKNSNKEDLGFVAVWDNNKIVYFKSYGNAVVIYDGDEDGVESATILWVKDGNVYYQQGDKNLYRKNIYTSTSATPAEKVVTNVVLDVSDGTNSATLFDYDNQYVYYYAKVTDTNEVNSYLHMAKLDNGYTDDEGNKIGKYVGSISKDDIKTEENTEDKPQDGLESEIEKS